MSDTTQDAKRRELRAAPIDQYPEADRAFFRFWYGHMVGDLMQPPLAGIRHSTARYIWDAAIRQSMADDAAGVQALGTRQPSLPRDLDSTIPRGQGVGTNSEPARREPTKVEPGSDLHLTLLMAPHGLNLVAAPDRSALLAYARDVWKAAAGVAPAAPLRQSSNQRDEKESAMVIENIVCPRCGASSQCDAENFCVGEDCPIPDGEFSEALAEWYAAVKGDGK